VRSRFHRATAPSLLRHFRDCVKGAPRELYANVLLTAGPADKDSLVVIQMCYVGPKEQGFEYLQALSSWTGERCLLNEVHEKTFLNQQDSVAQVLRGRRGNQWFIRSALISSLPDEVINKTVLEFADTPVGCSKSLLFPFGNTLRKSESHFAAWLFELSGGAIVDYEKTCVPKAQREAAFTIAALHQWEMGVDDPRCVSSAEDVRSSPPLCFPMTITLCFFPPLSTKQWLRETIKPVTCGGAFPSVRLFFMVQGRFLICSDATRSSLDGTRSPRACLPPSARIGNASLRSRRSMTRRVCSGTHSGHLTRMAARWTLASTSRRNQRFRFG
jgi:hypothetical protein